MRLRLAAVVSHPIQYQAPLFRRLASVADVELEVLFLSDHGLRATLDPGFGRVIQFDAPLLDGYVSRMVANRSPRPGLQAPFGLVNPGLAGRLLRGRYDAVWMHGYNYASSWIAFATAAALRLPIMLRGESTLLYETPLLKRAAKTALLSPLVRGAGALLVIGEENRRFYRSLGASEDQLFDAPYSVDNGHFARLADDARTSGAAAALRARLGAASEDVVVLFVGKLLARKRPGDVVEALARLGASGRRTVAAFVGEGELRPDVEAAIERTGVRAHLAGFINQSELPAWYAASDLFVLPSDKETWGLVVNEAMSAGLPVVASDRVGCTSDLIAGRGTGAVHRAGDVGSLADALAPLVSDRSVRQAASRRAIEVVAGYDVGVTATGIAAALRAVASRRSSGRIG